MNVVKNKFSFLIWPGNRFLSDAIGDDMSWRRVEQVFRIRTQTGVRTRLVCTEQSPTGQTPSPFETLSSNDVTSRQPRQFDDVITQRRRRIVRTHKTFYRALHRTYLNTYKADESLQSQRKQWKGFVVIASLLCLLQFCDVYINTEVQWNKHTCVMFR